MFQIPKDSAEYLLKPLQSVLYLSGYLIMSIQNTTVPSWQLWVNTGYKEEEEIKLTLLTHKKVSSLV